MSDQEDSVILVVEDEDLARSNLEHILNKEGYRTVGVDSGEKALTQLRSNSFDLVITDFKMDRVDGIQVLEKSRELHPLTEVIMITGYATVDLAVKTMKDGAFYYIAKPYKLDQVRKIVKEALIKRRLLLENRQLKAELSKSSAVPSLVGNSPAMKGLQETIRQIAPSDTSVLILGESGTGKELVAKAVHHMSPRADHRFVAFNCGSLTEELMANELFGHEKGAFTGAGQRQAGLIETANGGTVFLDEIGDMPMSMQIKLLRVIQEREVMRVGGVDPIRVDVRFIAATHRDLKEDTEKGVFRQDLFYRLNVITLSLPALAEREGDIALLAHHFLGRMNRTMNKDITDISRPAMALLSHYSWPGNVRELENVIERAVALANGDRIEEQHLPDYIRNLSIETYRLNHSDLPTLEEQEKRYIQWVLEKTGGNKTQAAKIMDIDRVSLWRKIKRYELEPAG